ncbi:hypothetical protein [Nocardia nova]|uniref:hypothetical protein n=1 Tax=Nocardia nova TaxID=37330 RepID=UPI001FE32B00|nr:hypothetical protein [Nocardia nova]
MRQQAGFLARDESLRFTTFGTGLCNVGSRIVRNANNPATATSRRFTVAAAYPSSRRPARSTTFGPGNLAARHAARNRSSTGVVTSSIVQSFAE